MILYWKYSSFFAYSKYWDLLRLREMHNTLQLPVFFFLLSFFFSFFCQPCPGRRNWKSILLNLKISQYGGWRRWVHFFPRYPCKQVLVTLLLQDHVTNLKHISTTKVSFATKLGRMVTYLDWLLPIKPHDPLITWSS